MKKARYIIEAAIVWCLFSIFRSLGAHKSSAIGGYLARKVGPMLKVDKLARENITTAMPELASDKVNEIVRDMWDNLGRTFAELPFLPDLNSDNITIEGKKILDQAIKREKGCILVTGHFANWEIGARSMAEINLPVVSVYRSANNPYVDKMIQQYRSNYNKKMVPKGREAAKVILKELKNKGIVGMLVDQKMNNGISVPFFGRDAMTAPAVAEFAKKFDCPIIPVQMIRNGDLKFTVKFHPTLNTEDKDSAQIMTDINAILESWIRENPSQWFWVHNRWK